MKIFISADIEGIATTTKWKETSFQERDYPYHCEEMTREVVAACRAAIDAGATEIVIKDAHGPATNIDIKALPDCATLLRGWSGHPYLMVEGIDGSFDAALFLGYHSECGCPGNPLSHTVSGRPQHLTVNGEKISEFWLYSRACAREGVPTVYLSGDRALCESSKARDPWLVTSALKEGVGDLTACLSPAKAEKVIYEDVYRALTQDLKAIPVPDVTGHYSAAVEYKEHADACRMSYYPGAARLDSHTVGFETDDFFELLRAMKFIL